ncbi:MAG: hypothetical protein CFH10_01074 [Alphaproteobacteria bacterium MarineAlpha4_Bin2]|nr:MAG: hypothetical protein CFH10_01074 [Alphaproteobacteria bacterium MarineAlpha4_Bin2]
MNRLIIIIIAVIVIAASGGAVWYFFLQADAPTLEAQKERQPAEKPEFVDIENLKISVIKKGRVDRYITISVSLEMQDKEAKILADQALPRLNDAFFRELHSYFSMQKPGQTGINVGQVKARLMWAAERAIGRGKVRRIIIQGAYERKRGSK